MVSLGLEVAGREASSLNQLRQLAAIGNTGPHPMRRFKLIAEILFPNDFNGLEDIKDQLTQSAAVYPMGIGVMLTQHFGDEAGNVLWTDWSAEVTRAIREKATNAALGSMTADMGGLRL